MKTFFTLVLGTCLFTCLTPLYAQHGLTGKLTDGKQALQFANVALLKAADSALAATALTDTAGRFSLAAPAAGDYLLKFSFIGFADTYTAPFRSDGPAYLRDFGTIALQTAGKSLDEVSITAMRPTIVQEADRIVVSVEGTAMAMGNTAYSVLAKAPGVFIDQEGNIQLNGRSGVTVMLDGRLTYLSAGDLRNLLESMPATNIRNIEIITNPSARYDAEGSSGILNINLKKNEMRGMNGSLTAGYNYNGSQHGYNANAALYVRKGDFNSFALVDFTRRVSGREATFTRVFYGQNQTTYFDQLATGNNRSVGPPRFRLGSDYSFNNDHSVGFVAAYSKTDAYSDFLTETFIGAAAANPTDFIDADNITRSNYQNFTSNLHYSGKLDTSGSTLSADLDYVVIDNMGESYSNNYFQDLQSTASPQADFLYSSHPNSFDIISFRADLGLPMAKGRKFETGIRASHVVADNDSRFYFNNGSLVPDPLRTNHFNFSESIYAAYANYRGALSPKLTLQAGLRAEQTRSTGISYTTGQENSRSYLNLFPSMFLQQKVSPDYSVTYSYGRRLQRPNYANMNPFRFYRDPYTYTEGNPNLRPQYAHAFSVTQTFKRTYNVIVSYQLTKDVISELPLLDVANATTVYYTGNVDDGHNLSLSASGPLKISKNWDSSNTLMLAYSTFNMTDMNGSLRNSQLFHMVQSNHTLSLPADLRMELNLLYRGPAAQGLYRMKPMGSVDLAFKRTFFKKKLDAGITASDLFKTMRLRFSTDINGNVNDFNQYFRNRSIGVSLRYNFSKGEKVDVRNRTGAEEVNRT